MFYDKLIIKGKHNLCNAMAASLVADITNIKNEKIRNRWQALLELNIAWKST